MRVTLGLVEGKHTPLVCRGDSRPIGEEAEVIGADPSAILLGPPANEL